MRRAIRGADTQAVFSIVRGRVALKAIRGELVTVSRAWF
jgi:hypothetical protein